MEGCDLIKWQRYLQLDAVNVKHVLRMENSTAAVA